MQTVHIIRFTLFGERQLFGRIRALRIYTLSHTSSTRFYFQSDKLTVLVMTMNN